MPAERVDVIATTTSGSIQDWKKVERIVPLFHEHGFDNVELHIVESHSEARTMARNVVSAGGRTPISAGGSGTFKAVMRGCIDSGVPLDEVRLGFLRKGSADLIGKVLEMPDEIVDAIAVFADSIRFGSTIPCDILLAESSGGHVPPQHFLGYGGAEIFGRIPYFTENRLTKWYKGILSQLFGDLGPFTTGMTLSFLERMIKGPWGGRGDWKITVDGVEAAESRYQALIILNGYLGPELSFTSDPLGSGHFHLFALRDIGLARLPRQLRAARSGAINAEPERWGLESFVAKESLELTPAKRGPFPANVDGSTLICHGSLRVSIVDRIPLIARRAQ